MDNLSEDILQALHHYADGQATPEEIQLVDAWISGLDFEEALSPEIESELDKIYNRSHEQLMMAANGVSANRFPRLNHRPLLTYGKVAASVIGLIILGAGAYRTLNFTQSGNKGNLAAVATTDAIVAGGKKAMLQLSDGRIVELNTVSVGELAKEGNASIQKAANGLVTYNINSQAVADKSAGDLHPLINTITIPVGGEYSLTLSDGTRVWLNAASTLRFPSEFSGNAREVELLQGQAYFDVAKDVKHPFHVTVSKPASGAMNIEVLGTAFNVSAYQEDDAIQTTLVNGAVRVSSQNGVQQAVLKPGNQASFSADNQLEVGRVDTRVATSWIDGTYYFDNTPLPKVLDELCRWYNVKVIYKNQPKNDVNITGSFDRKNTLDKVLEDIKFLGVNASFKLENRTIIVL